MPDRLFDVALGIDRISKVVVGFGIGRPQGDCIAKMFLRLRKLSLIHQDVAEIVVRFHVLAVKNDGLPIMRFGLTETAEHLKSGADVTVVIGNTIVACDCVADEIDCHFVLTALMCDDAKEMQPIRMIGINREDLLVNTLRLLKTAGLMQAKPVL